MGTFRYSTPLIIPDASEAKDRQTAEEITYLMNAMRTLATRLDTVTGALSPLKSTWGTVSPLDSVLGNNTYKFYAECSENIGFGAFVNFHNFSPTQVKARNAKASSFTRAACGFCATPGGYTTGQIGEFVVGPGLNFGIGGLTPGNFYYLDPVSVTGQVTAVQPTIAGQIIQVLGVAISDTNLLVGAFNNWRII